MNDLQQWMEADGGVWFYLAVGCVGLMLFAIVAAVFLGEKPVRVMCICPHCGCFGYPKLVQPGSALTFWILILCFVIPAVFYGLLREIGSRFVCPICGNPGMVPQDSPRGIKLQNEFHPPK